MITAQERRTKNKELQEAIYPRLIKRIENTMDHWNDLGQLYCEFDLTMALDYSEAVRNHLESYGYKVKLDQYMDNELNIERTILKISWAK